MKKSRLLGAVCACAVSMTGMSSMAYAATLSDTELGVGPIMDVDLFPKAAGTFDLGGTFSSITAATLTLDACDADSNCSDTLGSAEFYKFDLGPDSFDIGIGNPDGPQGAIVSQSLTLSAALIADLLDGVISFAVGAQTTAGFTFDANINFADITLDVTGDTAVVPIPPAV